MEPSAVRSPEPSITSPQSIQDVQDVKKVTIKSPQNINALKTHQNKNPLNLNQLDQIIESGAEAKSNQAVQVANIGQSDDHEDIKSYQVEDYMNADFLYENYFAEYGLPNTFKQEASVHLMMIANGIALTQRQGGDVRKAVNTVDLMLRKMLVNMSPTLRNNKVMKATEEEAIVQESEVKSDITLEEVFDQKNVAEPMQEVIIKAEEERQQFIEEQETLVKELNLPYPLTGKATKIMTPEALEQTMSKTDAQVAAAVIVGATVGFVAGGPAGAFVGGTIAASGSNVVRVVETMNADVNISSHNNIENWSWWNADIISGKNERSATTYVATGHLGSIYIDCEDPAEDDNNRGTLSYCNRFKPRYTAHIIEAYPKLPDLFDGNVDFLKNKGSEATDNPFRIYKERYNLIEAYYVPAVGTSKSETRRKVANYIYDKVGKGYHVNASKSSTSEYSCATLAYQAYKVAGGVDIEGSSNRVVILAPQDILDSGMTRPFSTSYAGFKSP